MSNFSHQLSHEPRFCLSVSLSSNVSLSSASNNQPQSGLSFSTMVHICPICCAVCHSPEGLGKHIRSRFQCVSALGLLPKRAPKWKAASARPRNLQLNTQQALKSSVAPLWGHDGTADVTMMMMIALPLLMTTAAPIFHSQIPLRILQLPAILV